MAHANRIGPFRYMNVTNPPGFQVEGMIEWGQKSKPQKLTPKKSHAEFPSLKNFQKALNDITQKLKT